MSVTAASSDIVLASEITHMWSKEDWPYLTVIIGLHPGMVVGGSISQRSK